MGFSKLMSGANFNNVEKARAALQEGTNVNEQNEYKYTALHIAANHHANEVARLLVQEYQADLTLTTDMGNTALHVAASHGAAQIAKLLVEPGANTQAKNKDGYVPADYADSIQFKSLAEAINTNSGWEVAFQEESKRELERKAIKEEKSKYYSGPFKNKHRADQKGSSPTADRGNDFNTSAFSIIYLLPKP